MTFSKKQVGFTIVELLVVIVVVGVLATITFATYSGAQGRASDAAIKSDLHNLGAAIAIFDVNNGRAPSRALADMPTDWAPMGVKLTKSAYGNAWMKAGTNGYNVVYCHDVAVVNSEFVIVAASRSGKVFAYQNGAVRDGVGPLDTHTVVCANNGLNTGGLWLYDDGVWRDWIGG